MSTIRYYLSYWVAKVYQFVATFPDFDGISLSVPTKYYLMSWWSITDFLCLLSNKLYPDKIEEGVISGAMINAMLDKMPKEMREYMRLQILSDELNKEEE